MRKQPSFPSPLRGGAKGWGKQEVRDYKIQNTMVYPTPHPSPHKGGECWQQQTGTLPMGNRKSNSLPFML